MTRLWDKGTPLDARVLAYTAGDDATLDNRLVQYDIRASIAHAEMLGQRGLLSPAELAAIRDALIRIGEETGRLEEMLEEVAEIYDQEVQRALERLLALLVPGITISMGVLIATIIASVLTAMISINDLAV